jgi:hypothetical protein
VLVPNVLALMPAGLFNGYDGRFSEPKQAPGGLPLRQASRQPQGEPRMHDVTERFRRACDGRGYSRLDVRYVLHVCDFSASQLFACLSNSTLTVASQNGADKTLQLSMLDNWSRMIISHYSSPSGLSR